MVGEGGDFPARGMNSDEDVWGCVLGLVVANRTCVSHWLLVDQPSELGVSADFRGAHSGIRYLWGV